MSPKDAISGRDLNLDVETQGRGPKRKEAKWKAYRTGLEEKKISREEYRTRLKGSMYSVGWRLEDWNY